MDLFLQAHNQCKGLNHSNTSSASSTVGFQLLLLLALYLLVPFQVNATTFDEEVSALEKVVCEEGKLSTPITITEAHLASLNLDATEKTALLSGSVKIYNKTSCTMTAFCHEINASGKVYNMGNINAGGSKTIYPSASYGRAFCKNASTGKETASKYFYGSNYSLNVTSGCGTTSTVSCNAELEHFSAVAETGCNKKDGKIITDPYIDRGLKLPYYVQYNFNGSTKKHGPFHQNKDNYITGLAPGVYKNLTAIDANGCKKNHGNVTVKAGTCATACDQKLTIKNNGSCPVHIYHWLPTGDVYKKTVQAGNSWTTAAKEKQMWRVINTQQDWNNLLFDEHVTVGSNCAQTWSINPTYCNTPVDPVPPVTPTCNLSVDAGADQSVCAGSEVQLIASSAGASDCSNSCCTRTASNTTQCKNGNSYVFYLSDGVDIRNFHITNNSVVTWEECADGSIHFTAKKLKAGDGSGELINLDFTYTGKTKTEQADGHKAHNCEANYNKNNWTYYTGLTGTFTSNQRGTFSVSRRGNAFQIGYGANVTSTGLGYGACNWFDATGGNGQTLIGDVNIMLSAQCAAVAETGNSQEVTYAWSNGQAGASISVNESGTYTVTATDCNGCTATDEVAVSIENAPAITAQADGTITCSTEEVELSISGGSFDSYEWSGPNGFSSTQEFPLVSEAGNYQVIATTANGCTATASVEVADDVTNPSISVSNNDGPLSCAVSSINLSLLGNAGTYAWTGPNGFSSTSFRPSVSEAGTYTVVVTVANGCTATASIEVLSDDTIPSISAENDGPISCSISSVSLNVSGDAGTYEWSGPNGFSSSSTNPTVSEAGTYTVVVTADNGCIATASTEVFGDDDLPVISAENDGPISCDFTAVSLSVSGDVGAYEWTGPNGFLSNIASPTVSAAGTYTVVITAANGCTATASTEVTGTCDPTTKIGDLVFNDLNNNGVQEAGEPGVAGIGVQLIDAGPDGEFHTGDDLVADATVTDAQGLYSFDVQEGMYCIQILQNTLPTNFVFAPQDAMGDIIDQVDSDADATGKIDKFTVTAGQADDLSFDAGIYEEIPPVLLPNIGDLVFNDLNKDGIQDANEPGVADVGVQLIAAGSDGIFHTGDDAVADATVTDENGNYLFTDVPAGQYCIQVLANTIPNNFVFTTANADIDDFDSDADANGKIPAFTVTEGQADDLSFDAGIYEEAPVNPTLSVGDVIVNEEDGTAMVEICLDQVATQFVYVRYMTMDADAIAGTDYVSQTSYAFIPQGQQCAKINVTILDDEIEEEDEALKIVLSSPFNADIADGEGMITILDTDEPVCEVQGGLIEGGPYEFCVGDGEADNIPAGSIVLVENAGAISQWVVTDATGTTILGLPAMPSAVDFDGAGVGTCLVWHLSHDGSLSGAEMGAAVADLGGCYSLSNSVSVNRVECVMPVVIINDVVVNEEDGTAMLDICLDQVSDKVVTVRYTTADGSAIVGEDYQVIDGVATVNPGELCTKVTFPILDDATEEPTESFVVNLTAPSNATILDDQGTVTILDTDEPAKPVLSITDVVVNEEDGTAMLDICLDQVATQFVYVRYVTMDDSAIAGEDYTTQSSYAFIPQGQQCAKVTFNILDDATEELDEIFKVVLSSPFNADIADGEGTVTILDTDEPAPVIPAIVIDDVVVNEEDGTASLTISLSEPTTQAVVVTYTTSDASAIDGVDYVSSSNTVTIPAGQTSTTVTFPILDDSTEEPTEEFLVDLTAPVNAIIADPQGTVTILDTDEPVIPSCITITDDTVNENEGFANVQICLDQPSTETVTVDCITVDGSAIGGSDYTVTQDVLIFEPGQMCKQVSVQINDDAEVEGEEFFFIRLSNVTNASICDDEALITIIDNDVAPVIPAIVIDDVVVNEEDGTASLTISLSEPTTQAVVVTYTTGDASAIDGVDYVGSSNTVTIPAGQTSTTVTFPILDDSTEEPTEEFLVDLTAPVNATITDPQGTVTILDTDIPAPVIPAIVIDDVVVNEEDGTASLTISLSEPTTQAVVVTYTTGDASAIDGVDYTGSSNTVTIPAGQTSATVIFSILDDNTEEPTEEFLVDLSAPVNATIADPQGTVTILDTDVPVMPSCITITDDTVNENEGFANVQICLDKPATETITIDCITADGTAIGGSDYVVTQDVLIFEPGQMCKQVSVQLIDDTEVEGTEEFTIQLSNASNADICDGEAIITIIDNDVAPVIPAIGIDDIVVFEDEGFAIVTVCLDQTTTNPVSVDYASADQSAIEAMDYVAANGVASIPAGQTCTEIVFPILEDSNDEQDEVFVIDLTAPVNATIADPQGTVTIIDNDDPIVITPSCISVSDTTANENEGFAHVQICLDRPSLEVVTVDCITADGTAIGGTDYVITQDVLIFNPGEMCKQVSIKIFDDEIHEGAENFFINLSNASNASICDAQGEVVINDNDQARVDCPDMDVVAGEGTITVSGLSAPIEIVQIFDASWNIVFQCMNNCNPTEVVENLPAGTYNVRINCYNDSWNLICKEEATVTVLDGTTPPTTQECQGNITNGGRIDGQESLCGSYDPITIGSEIDPTGGSDASQIEYLWLASTAGCPRELVDQVAGATGASYDPGTITETTYFVRCSRRVGCNVWVESNCVVKEVYCEDDNGTEGTPATDSEVSACGDVTITYGNGEIEMAGVAGLNYYFKVNAIDQGWSVVHGCSSNCGSTQTATGLTNGKYLITIYNADWSSHCQTEIVLSSSLDNETTSSERSAATATNDKVEKAMDKNYATAKDAALKNATNKSIEFLNSNQSSLEITLFPNPVVDRLNVNLSSLAGQTGNLYLSNNIGQVVKELSIEAFDTAPVQLQLGQLPSGLYHLTVVADGQLITTEKVMIQRK